MKQVIIGMLAHVDAGKTTLTESLLYESGALKSVGRVDHGTAFLDTDSLEKSRGITIYSKEARFEYEDTHFTLMDTPGHMDFSPEMERTLQVLDYAVLVISGTDGVQSHTETLWHLLEKHKIPTFLFINKMDLPDTDEVALLSELKSRLHPSCVDFTHQGEDFLENIALCQESILEKYLECGKVADTDIGELLSSRQIFPCFFGSALKMEEVKNFLRFLQRMTVQFESISKKFAGKVFKITRDPHGTRLTLIKVTGGNLAVKDILETGEKVNEIRLYSGTKYESVYSVGTGTVCALVGLQETQSGQGLGSEPPSPSPVLAPVLTYGLNLPTDCDAVFALKQLKQLQEEDPALEILWLPEKQSIQIQIMGDVQVEVLSHVIEERFHMAVTFSERAIIYRETLAEEEKIIGVGHYEPLRHYAEVVLQMESLPPDSGLIFAVDTKQLEPQHQHLIIGHLQERLLTGVLTASPLTDLKITLIGGRAHLKHTEGGDFREATFRALRQGLLQGKSLLLEPWMKLEFLLPTTNLGRAMSDMGRMGGIVGTPEALDGEFSSLSATAPLSQLGNYNTVMLGYTQGKGKLHQSLLGYRPCENPSAMIAKIGYDPMSDIQNPAESIFCKHGAGYSVPWEEVHDHAHCPLPKKEEVIFEEDTIQIHRQRVKTYANQLAEDKDLLEIFQRTYGKIDSSKLESVRKLNSDHSEETDNTKINLRPWTKTEEYLLVDGYNIIFAWDDLQKMAEENLDSARMHLLNQLCNFQAFRHCQVIVVFDAYKVKGGVGSVIPFYNITQVFTKEAETADMYIEKVTNQLARDYRVRVATSDAVEQRIILGHGALRLSARGLEEEMQVMHKAMSKYLN